MGDALVEQAMTVAAAAVRAGAARVEAARDGLRVRAKGDGDLTTSADAAAHEAVVATITEAFGDHAIVGEDGGHGSSPRRWYVDALDGTLNYRHRLPYYVVSAALWDGDTPVAGAVADPVHDELYLAGRGGGATRNGTPIAVSDAATLADGVVVTQSAARSPEGIARFTDLLSRLMASTGGVRMPGSRVLALCHVADGRFAGAAERSLDPWDLAAAGLIITEAGGTVTGFDGRPAVPAGADDRLDVVAAPAALHPALLILVGSP